MKSFRLFAAICAVVLSAGATKTANALDLDFYFRGAPDQPFGWVSGEVDGLPYNGGGSASAVFLNGWPYGVGKICSAPCNTMAPPWHVTINGFTVSYGQVVDGEFISTGPTAELDLFVGHSGPADLVPWNALAVVGNVIFGPCQRVVLICPRPVRIGKCGRRFLPCP